MLQNFGGAVRYIPVRNCPKAANDCLTSTSDFSGSIPRPLPRHGWLGPVLRAVG